MRWTLPIFLILMLGLSACVTQQKYDELEAVKDYYVQESKGVDSIRYEFQQLNNRLRNSDALVRESTQELEELTIANQSLQQSYNDLVNRFNQIVEQNKNTLTTSSYEKLGLQEQLSAQQAELDRRARELAVMEYELNVREGKLSALEGSYENAQGSLAERNKRIMELEAMLQNNQFVIQNLRTTVSGALTGFSDTDLTVEEKNGRLYVSLSQELLFRSGSDNVESKGRQALKQLADVLKKNPEIDITVEGHTDDVGNAASNWDLSVMRATSVVKVLTTYGIEPERVTASGRGLYAPIASNATATGKAQNRRTEIILSPKLDQLYQLLDR